MVTTTTKTLNYSIIRGNHTNSVNATITSTPGFNINYFGKIPGILKVLELIIIIVTIGLAASRRYEGRNNSLAQVNPSVETWLIEFFLTGEVFFLCVQTAGLVWLFSILVTYAMHIVSSVIIPKTTIHEVVFTFMFILMFWTAGIVELAKTVPNSYGYGGRRDMEQGNWGCRVAAGALSLFTGTFFLISFALAVKELQGPKRSAPISASPISTHYVGDQYSSGVARKEVAIVTVIALGLAASRRREGTTDIVGWPIEFFLAGEVFFLCIASTGLTYLFGQLTVFLWSVTSSVLIPKTTYFEVVINFFLTLCWITAGIVLLCMTSREGWNDRWPMNYSDWGCRIAAGALGLFLAVFHAISFGLAVKEFVGPRNEAER